MVSIKFIVIVIWTTCDHKLSLQVDCGVSHFIHPHWAGARMVASHTSIATAKSTRWPANVILIQDFANCLVISQQHVSPVMFTSWPTSSSGWMTTITCAPTPSYWFCFFWITPESHWEYQIAGCMSQHLNKINKETEEYLRPNGLARI